MSTEDNKANVRRFTEEGVNQGNVAVFDELCASNWVYHDPSFPNVRTLEDYKRFITETHSAFPDFHVTIEDVIAEGDQVVLRSTWRGTNTGDIVTPMPLYPTGKQVTVTGITIVRFAGGKGVEVWSQGDSLGLFQQLGLIPLPGQAS
jgi:predicted ester cyclase